VSIIGRITKGFRRFLRAGTPLGSSWGLDNRAGSSHTGIIVESKANRWGAARSKVHCPPFSRRVAHRQPKRAQNRTLLLHFGTCLKRFCAVFARFCHPLAPP